MTGTGEPDGGTATRPVLRVIRGDATDEEIAVILALVTARSAAAGAQEAAARAASLWSSPSNGHRARATDHAHRHGWRTSYWPH